MAIAKIISTPYKIDATYLRITNINYDPEKKLASVSISGWRSEDDYNAGGMPIYNGNQEFNIADNPDALAIWSQAQSAAQQALVTLPGWTDGVIV
jgi:hypothetical protein